MSDGDARSVYESLKRKAEGTLANKLFHPRANSSSTNDPQTVAQPASSSSNSRGVAVPAAAAAGFGTQNTTFHQPEEAESQSEEEKSLPSPIFPHTFEHTLSDLYAVLNGPSTHGSVDSPSAEYHNSKQIQGDKMAREAEARHADDNSQQEEDQQQQRQQQQEQDSQQQEQDQRAAVKDDGQDISKGFRKDHTSAAYAFSGIAYDHRVLEKYQGNVLCMSAVHQTKFEPSTHHVTPLEPSELELTHDNIEGVPSGVFVGMYLPGKEQLLKSTFHQIPGYQGTRKKAATILNHSDPIIVPYSEQAYRVVALRGKSKVIYYALVNQKDHGLCEGIGIGQNQVFFFKMYRDDTASSVSIREEKTQHLIRKAISINDVEAEDTVRDRRNEYEFRIPQQNGMYNKMRTYAAIYKATKNVAYLKKIQDLVENRLKIVGSISYSNVYILRLFDAHLHVFSEDHAKNALKEIQDFWPAVAKMPLSVPCLIDMKTGLLERQISVKSSHIRAFLVAFNVSWQVLSEKTPGTLGKLAVATKILVDLQLGHGGAQVTTYSDNKLLEFLFAIRDTLYSFKRIVEQRTRDRAVAREGVPLPVLSLDDLYDIFSKAPDVEAGKFLLGEMNSLNMVQLELGDDAFKEQLDEISASVEAFLADVPQSAEDGDVAL